MYNENSNFSIKNVIIQVLFIALFIFLLIWLFPLKSDLKDLNINNDNTSILVDRIFNENIIAMKDGAKDYFTLERLPQNIGDKVKITLGEMLEKKIVLPFTDKNGDTCSLTDSYVEITKYDTEYIMKVNLKCGEEENYLLVYMGCYDYCSTTVCEKNESDVKTPVIYPSKPETPSTPVTPSVPETPVKPEQPEQPETPDEPEVPVEYLYEYSKTTPAYCTESNWSEWSKKEVKADKKTIVETKTEKEKKLIGYKIKKKPDYTKPIYGEKDVVIGKEKKDVCTKYGYVPTGDYSYGEWTYVETVYLSYSPTNTDTVQYIKIDESSSECGENCTATTTKAYKKYTRTKTPITKYQCTNWEQKEVDITTTIKVIVGYEMVIVSKEPVYEEYDVTYYRYKTKTCYDAVTDKKWSIHNDRTLLDNGYTYTGNKKVKK